MAQNLASKYEKQFDAAFRKGSHLEGKICKKYTFDGAKEINIYAPVTVELNNYERTGASRYGDPTEMDNTIQKMTLTQDKGFTKTLDRGNYTDSQMAISAGAWMQEQIDQQVRPAKEKWAIAQWIKYAGKTVTITAKPTKTTVSEAYMNLITEADNGFCPDEGRYIYVPASIYGVLKLAPEWIGVDKLGEKALEKGVIGEFSGAKVVKLPDSYFPEGCYALLAHRDAVINPCKISTFKTHTNPPGIDGWLMEGRVYYDAFVLANKCDGVIALVLAGNKLETPTQTSGAITCSDATVVKYTLDGSDPRYSGTAQVSTGAAVGKSGDTVKAVGFADDKFTSDVLKFTR